MASIVVGSASAEATTVTMPSHVAGDLLIVSAYRHDGQIDSIPSGWNGVRTSFSSNGLLFIAKIAASASESTPTMSNADLVIAAVIRGDTVVHVNFDASVASSDDTIRFTGFASGMLVYMGGRSYYTVGTRNKDASIETPPTQLALVSVVRGSSDGSLAVYESEAVTVGGSLFDIDSITPGETLGQWRSAGLLVLDTTVDRGSSGGIQISRGMNGGMR